MGPGLAAGFLWGSADFIAKGVLARIGFLRALLLASITGTLALWALTPAKLAPDHHAGPLVGLGLLAAVAGLLLYYAFEHGNLSVVAPIASTYPVITIALEVWLDHRRFGPVTLGALALLIGGAVAVGASSGTRPGAQPQVVPEVRARFSAARGAGRSAPVLAAAVGTAISSGVLQYILAPLDRLAGPYTTLFYLRGIGALIYAFILGARGGLRQAANGAPWLPIVAVSILDTAAFLLYIAGTRTTSIGVVATTSGLWGAWGAFYGVVLLRERLTTLQWSGVGAIVAGVITLCA